MQLVEIVRKLIGPIQPIGETNADKIRLANLEATTELIDCLLFEVQRVAAHAGRPEKSMSKAGQDAQRYLLSIRDFVPVSDVAEGGK